MSRIAGLFALDGAGGFELMVKSMLEAMPRGEDAFVSSGAASLGWSGRAGGGAHRAGKVCVALDGEIYNFAELARTLEDAPRTDAELVASLYQRHEFANTLRRFNGDFALVLYDGALRKLWLARDRAGIKPLYYAISADRIAWASQPAALLRLPGVEPAINRAYAARIAGMHYRTFDNLPEDAPFASMRQVPAAHYAEVSLSGAVHVRPYWRLEDAPDIALAEAEVAEQYRELLLRAVARRLAQSGRRAFTISGGMDSSSVLSCAARIAGERQHAFSSVYRDPTYDERAEIQDMVREKIECWHAVEIGDDIDVLDSVARLVAIHNEPVATATWLSHEVVCRRVAAEGFDALFGGMGGDELNAGEYEYFPLHFADLAAAGANAQMAREIERWAAYHDHPIHRKDAAVAAELMARLTVPGSAGKCRPDLVRQRRYAHAVRREYCDLLAFEPVMEHPFRSFLKNRAWQDLTRETTPCCLRAEDRQTTHAGLRHYDPFLDRDLIEFMFRVPGTLKIRDGVTKWLLREAMKGILPEPTRTRIKKTGWNAPAHVWFSGKGLDAVRDLLRTRRFRERDIYDMNAVHMIVEDHAEIIRSGESRENHMMFLWQLVNIDAWLNWIEAFG